MSRRCVRVLERWSVSAHNRSLAPHLGGFSTFTPASHGCGIMDLCSKVTTANVVAELQANLVRRSRFFVPCSAQELVALRARLACLDTTLNHTPPANGVDLRGVVDFGGKAKNNKATVTFVYELDTAALMPGTLAGYDINPNDDPTAVGYVAVWGKVLNPGPRSAAAANSCACCTLPVAAGLLQRLCPMCCCLGAPPRPQCAVPCATSYPCRPSCRPRRYQHHSLMPPPAWTACSPLTTTPGSATANWVIPFGPIQSLPWTLVGLDMKAAAEPQPLGGDGGGDDACFELALTIHDFAMSMGSAEKQFKALELAELLEDKGYPALGTLTSTVLLEELTDIVDQVMDVCPAHKMDAVGNLQAALEDAQAALEDAQAALDGMALEDAAVAPPSSARVSYSAAAAATANPKRVLAAMEQVARRAFIYALSDVVDYTDFTESQLSALNCDEWDLDWLVRDERVHQLIILAQPGNASHRVAFGDAVRRNGFKRGAEICSRCDDQVSALSCSVWTALLM